jgi:maleate isomerase
MTSTIPTHRFGLLTPSSNTTQEREFAQVLPRHVSLHTGRLSFTNIDADTMVRCIEELESESRKLADAEVDVIAFAATAPSVTHGRGYDRQLIERIAKASGKPATTASTAFLEALEALRLTRIAIAAPWSESMNASVVAFLSANGFTVVHSEVMGLVRNTQLGRVDPETAYAFGRKADRPEAQAVIVPGGNWPTMAVVERLEQELGKPVLTNNAVSIWAGLRLIGLYESISGYGSLLREHLRTGT